MQWLVEAPQNSIILLEDVDVAFLNQDRSSKKSEGKSAYEDLFGRPRTVTFSGIPRPRCRVCHRVRACVCVCVCVRVVCVCVVCALNTVCSSLPFR